MNVQGVAMPSPDLTDRVVRRRLEAVARRAVRSPAIDAVALFGSRARGDYRPDSDWDVALLARSDCGHPDMVATGRRIEEVDRHSEFHLWARTTEYLQTYADRSNRLACAVATQGVPLAGKWPLTPAGQEGRQVMDLESMQAQQVQVCEYITKGWLLAGMSSSVIEPDTRGVSRESCMAAELLAKDVIASHSVLPVCSHDLNRLAEQLDGLRLEAGESEEQRHCDVDTLRRMDGITAKPNFGSTDYSPAGLEGLEKGMQRLVLTMELQVSWLSRCAIRGPDWNQAARDVGKEIVGTADTMTKRNFLDFLPNRAVHAIKKWEAKSRRMIYTGHS